MADDDWYKPRRTPDWPRQPAPGELLFECYRERDHSRWLCELRDDGVFRTVALFYQNEELIIARRFEPRLDPTRTPREMAIAWANEERRAIEAYEPDTSSLWGSSGEIER